MRPDLLLGRFDGLIQTPDDVAQLEAAILDLAVRGMLVSQDSNDEPASVLISNMLAEKRRLVRENQIPRSRKLPPVSSDEIPYQQPSGWTWVRLGEITVKMGSGSTPRGGRNVYQNHGIKFIRSQNVWNDGLKLDDVAFISDKINQQMSNTIVQPRDILLNITGASIGRATVVPDDFDIGNVSQHVSIIRLADVRTRHFIHFCLVSSLVQSMIWGVQVGISRPGLSKKRLEEFPIPLPPLAEQKRIVARVEELLAQTRALAAELAHVQSTQLPAAQSAFAALTTPPVIASPARSAGEAISKDISSTLGIATSNASNSASSPYSPRNDSVGAAWARIAAHFDQFTATPEMIDALKQTILQLAVQGQLVPQDPDDEPASVLLERIEAEKDQIKKEKGIRETKPLPTITEDVPFSLPSGWEWVWLDDLCYQITDGTHYTPTYVDSGIPFLSVKDISGGFLDFSDTRFITEEEHAKLTKRCRPELGDILLTKVGTTGIAKLVDTEREFSIFVSVALLKFDTEKVYPLYLENVINSPLVKQQSAKFTMGIGNKNLVLKYIRNFFVPLPPLAEQQRIVARVEELLALCDALASEATAAEAARSRLLGAVLNGGG